MTEPKPIEPQDVRPGDRICVAWSAQGVDRTATLTVAEVDLESMLVKNTVDCWSTLDTAGRATITLLDRPEPERPVGSHWLGVVGDQNIEYVLNTRGEYLPVRMPDGWSVAVLRPDYDPDEIARLTPISAFDPAALWPAANSVTMHCLTLYTAEIGWMCSRPIGHDGLHAAYTGHAPGAENLRYVWGDPR